MRDAAEREMQERLDETARIGLEFFGELKKERERAAALEAALRDLHDALADVVVVKGGVTPTLVAPSMNALIEPLNRARHILAAASVSTPQEGAR